MKWLLLVALPAFAQPSVAPTSFLAWGGGYSGASSPNWTMNTAYAHLVTGAGAMGSKLWWFSAMDIYEYSRRPYWLSNRVRTGVCLEIVQRGGFHVCEMFIAGPQSVPNPSGGPGVAFSYATGMVFTYRFKNGFTIAVAPRGDKVNGNPATPTFTAAVPILMGWSF